VKEWVLRDEILAITHRWPVIVAFFLVGSLLGWLAAFLWPSPYRATDEIAVNLNFYRVLDDRYLAAYSQTEFLNADDYKNWQMSQLNQLALSDEYLQETLERLRNRDAYWKRFELDGLRRILHVSWRDIGRLNLAAENSQPIYAIQAVSVWKDVILEKTGLAISRSRELFLLELQLRTIEAEEVNVRLRLEELPESRAALLIWRNQRLPEQGNEPLKSTERWQLWSLAARSAAFDPGWEALLNEIPVTSALPLDYIVWIDRLIVTIDQDIALLPGRLDRLEVERAATMTLWEKNLQEGDGLAATLVVEGISEAPPVVKKNNPGELLALIGGFLGLLIFGLGVVISLSRTPKILAAPD
jgi:hypothetical protein